MTLKDKILALSTIGGCATLTEHICSAIIGVNARVFGTYNVEYIPTEKSKMMYVLPSRIPIQYIAQTLIDVEYIKIEKSSMKYIASPTIKIVHKCNTQAVFVSVDIFDVTFDITFN